MQPSVLWIRTGLLFAVLMVSPFAVNVQAGQGQVLLLDDCISMALDGNLLLQMQRLQLSSASADIQVVSAIYDPHLQLNGSWQDSELPPGSFPSPGGVEMGQGTARLFREFSSGTRLGIEFDVQRSYFEGFSATEDPLWRTAAGFTLRQSLWRNSFGEADRARIEYARRRLESLRLEYEQTRDEVSAQAADLFWQAGMARAVAGVQTATVYRLGLLLENNRKRVEEGLLDVSAVLAVEASLAVAEVDAEVLRHEALARDEQLKNTINLSVDQWDNVHIDYRIHSPGDGMVRAPTFVEVYENALHYRPDLEALRREERRVEDLIRLRRSEDRAEVQVSGSIGRGDAGNRWDDSLSFDRNIWAIGLVADLSLGRSDTRAKVAQAFMERDRIRTEIEMLERHVALACRAAVRQADTAYRLVGATDRARRAQQQKIEREIQRFERGQSDTKTLLDYENDRDLADRDHLRALGAWQRARVNLDLVQGIIVKGDVP